ncbi:MAG: DUF2007 domain-containing protein [Deltaproteobacteria bacterium]|nr:DUF2007 domain-containing protein [Deltaproteobacteria bacterium]
MKYCAQCSTEYRDDIGICSDCGAVLVGQEEWDRILRAREQETAEEFLPVKTAEDQFAAEVFSDALEKEGIPVIVRSFAETSFDGIFIPQKGWGMILVPKEFCDRARQIILSVETSLPSQSDQ